MYICTQKMEIKLLLLLLLLFYHYYYQTHYQTRYYCHYQYCSYYYFYLWLSSSWRLAVITTRLLLHFSWARLIYKLDNKQSREGKMRRRSVSTSRVHTHAWGREGSNMCKDRQPISDSPPPRRYSDNKQLAHRTYSYTYQPSSASLTHKKQPWCLSVQYLVIL